MNTHGAIFDLDGTLLHSLHVWEKIDCLFLQKRNLTIPKDYTKIVANLGFREAARYTVERFSLQDSPEAVITEWNNMARKAYAEEIKLKPGVKEYLLFLKQRKVRLAVATALNPDSMELCLKNNGIYHLFDSFTTLQEVERSKNFPDIYLLAAEKIACQPQQCEVFEDILVAVLSAKAGGFKVCGVYDSYSEHEWTAIQANAHRSIQSFEDLLP